MVHYGVGELQSASPTLPPLCPTCGSHRTEIVGRSKDGRSVTVRCRSCGERSAITLEPATAAVEIEATADREIEAMRAIAEALAQLSPGSRARVLRWTRDRFEMAATSDDASVAPAVAADDESLAVEDLYTFFTTREDNDIDDLCGLREIMPPAEEIAPPPPVAPVQAETTVHSFVADFKRLAEDWQSALLEAVNADVTA
jgi:hypothetical protein